MIETLHGSNGQDQTRIRRAFGWLVTFRDFPAGSYQLVDGDSMMEEALTLFTKGRAEFYLDGTRRGDRVPGILSSEHEVVGKGGTFKLVYVEPTSRVCIPSIINRGKLPNVSKVIIEQGQRFQPPVGFKGLVCLGAVNVAGKQFDEEHTFSVVNAGVTIEAVKYSMLLDFTHAYSPR